MIDSEPLAIIADVSRALENLGVRYMIGGSVASSTHGAYRLTEDIDFVAELEPRHVDGFVAALQSTFYIDEEMVKSEVHPGGTFNIFFKATAEKADFFVIPAGDAWYAEQMSRRISIDFGDIAPAVFVASPEDIVLQKLRWYRMSNERSDKQWGDVTGVLKEQSEWLELGYMRTWAARLGVTDLLDRALDDSGIPGGDSP